MLNQIATILEQAVDRIGLIEQWDGVVRRVTVKGETFPVSCTDPTACSKEHYRKAVPNQDLNGLAYVEQRGPAQVGTREAYGYTMTYPVRLIMWINAGKQSIPNCSDVIAQAELNVLTCLMMQKAITPTFSSKPINATISNIKVLAKTPGEIFQGLAYNDQAALYVWPYAYTAIDCEIIFEIPANCITAVAATVAENCIEY